MNLKRIDVLIGVIALLFVIIALRLSYIVVSDNYIQHQTKIKKKIKRYDIIDRNGEMLATNLITYSLYARPFLIKEDNLVITNLAKLFPDLNKEYLLKKLAKKKRGRLVLVRRDLTPKEKLEISKLGIIGFEFHEDIKRIYPFNNLFAHVLGYVDKDENGLAGVEKYFNSYLKGNLLTDKKYLQLSLDANIQNIVYRELSKGVKRFSAKGATAIVMNVKNGEIYSLVSLPDFDPYNPIKALRDRNYNNKASFNLHEMGSTFKSFTMAMALENNLLKLDEKFDVSDNLRIAGFTIKDFKKIKEPITAREVFYRSSNIGTARIAQRIGEDLQKEFLTKLGFFKPLDIEIIEKSHSNMPRRWGLSRTITASYGYGVSISSVHLIQASAAMINGGMLVKATLVKNKNDSGFKERIITSENSEKLRDLMRMAVKKGTGRGADAKGYDVGGKTGSANKVGNRGYDENRLLSSFIAAFPMSDPKFAIFVYLDEPKGIEATGGYATGGATAAPIVKKIVERISPLLHIYPSKNRRGIL